MPLSVTALTTLAKAKSQLGVDDTTLTANGLAVYHDGTGGAATATVEVTSTTIVLTSSIGGQSQTRTFAAATDDTLTEMVPLILPANGWIVTLLTNGAALSTDLVPRASASCLLLANQQILPIVDNYNLEVLIEGVSEEIQQWLQRDILSATYTETMYLEPGECSVDEIVLAQPDVTAVERVSVDTLHALTVTYSGADVRATVEVTSTSVITRSTSLTTTTTFVAATTLAAIRTAIQAVANWTCTIPGGIDTATPSTYLVRTPGRKCKTQGAQLTAWDDYDGDYLVKYNPGIVHLAVPTWPYSSREAIGCITPGQLQIAYTAGYATVPADVEQVAHEMIQAAYNRRGSDQTLQSESLEGYSYTRQLGAVTDQTESWRNRLYVYKRELP